VLHAFDRLLFNETFSTDSARSRVRVVVVLELHNEIGDDLVAVEDHLTELHGGHVNP
jgi:hypothetical protein